MSTPQKDLEEVTRLKRINKKILLELCKKNKLYQTPHLNDVLYLHYQGFQDIEGLDEYIGLKCLWLESNAISEIRGLNNQPLLKCLFLQNNLLRKIENLHNCRELDTINLAYNHISSIDNCGTDILPVLSNLNLSNNYIKTYDSLKGVLECKMLSVLDLSNNRIEDALVVKIFSQMPELRVLVLQGNPVVGHIPQYRKTLILECKNLTYLDSRPVFPKDRACAEAWKRGGYEEERAEQDRWIKEEQRKMRECVNSMIRLKNNVKKNGVENFKLLSSDDENGESHDSDSDSSDSESDLNSKKKNFENNDKPERIFDTELKLSDYGFNAVSNDDIEDSRNQDELTTMEIDSETVENKNNEEILSPKINNIEENRTQKRKRKQTHRKKAIKHSNRKSVNKGNWPRAYKYIEDPEDILATAIIHQEFLELEFEIDPNINKNSDLYQKANNAYMSYISSLKSYTDESEDNYQTDSEITYTIDDYEILNENLLTFDNPDTYKTIQNEEIEIDSDEEFERNEMAKQNQLKNDESIKALKEKIKISIETVKNLDKNYQTTNMEEDDNKLSKLFQKNTITDIPNDDFDTILNESENLKTDIHRINAKIELLKNIRESRGEIYNFENLYGHILSKPVGKTFDDIKKDANEVTDETNESVSEDYYANLIDSTSLESYEISEQAEHDKLKKRLDITRRKLKNKIRVYERENIKQKLKLFNEILKDDIESEFNKITDANDDIQTAEEVNEETKNDNEEIRSILNEIAENINQTEIQTFLSEKDTEIEISTEEDQITCKSIVYQCIDNAMDITINENDVIDYNLVKTEENIELFEKVMIDSNECKTGIKFDLDKEVLIQNPLNANDKSCVNIGNSPFKETNSKDSAEKFDEQSSVEEFISIESNSFNVDPFISCDYKFSNEISNHQDINKSTENNSSETSDDENENNFKENQIYHNNMKDNVDPVDIQDNNSLKLDANIDSNSTIEKNENIIEIEDKDDENISLFEKQISKEFNEQLLNDQNQIDNLNNIETATLQNENLMNISFNIIYRDVKIEENQDLQQIENIIPINNDEITRDTQKIPSKETEAAEKFNVVPQCNNTNENVINDRKNSTKEAIIETHDTKTKYSPSEKPNVINVPATALKKIYFSKFDIEKIQDSDVSSDDCPDSESDTEPENFKNRNHYCTKDNLCSKHSERVQHVAKLQNKVAYLKNMIDEKFTPGNDNKSKEKPFNLKENIKNTIKKDKTHETNDPYPLPETSNFKSSTNSKFTDDYKDFRMGKISLKSDSETESKDKGESHADFDKTIEMHESSDEENFNNCPLFDSINNYDNEKLQFAKSKGEDMVKPVFQKYDSNQKGVSKLYERLSINLSANSSKTNSIDGDVSELSDDEEISPKSIKEEIIKQSKLKIRKSVEKIFTDDSESFESLSNNKTIKDETESQ